VDLRARKRRVAAKNRLLNPSAVKYLFYCSFKVFGKLGPVLIRAANERTTVGGLQNEYEHLSIGECLFTLCKSRFVCGLLLENYEISWL
jgi:hypothetical protein